MAELYLRGIDADELREGIARDVVALLRPVLAESTRPTLVDFDGLLRLVPVSRSTLERTNVPLPALANGSCASAPNTALQPSTSRK